jgi:polyhydroxyalkanoate synthesis regulator phasin
MAEQIQFDDLFGSGINNDLKELESNLSKITKSTQELIETSKKGIKFDIDTEIKKIEQATGSIQQQQKAVEESAKSINQLSKEQKTLNAASGVTEKLFDQQAKSITQLRQELKQAKGEYEQLNQEQRENSQIGQDLRSTITANTKLIKELTDASRNQVVAFDKANATYRDASARLTALKKQLRDIPGALDRNSNAFKQNERIINSLEQEISELDQELKGFDKTLGESFRNVGNYGDALQGLGANFQGLGGGLSGVLGKGGGQGISGFTQGLSGGAGVIGKFLPQIAVATAAIGGLSVAFNELNELVQQTNKELNTVNQILQLTGEDADVARARIAAISQTFEVEFVEATQAANILVRDFGLEFNDALDLIEQGLLRGANANGDFLDQIREYGPQFTDANLSAESLINTIGSAVVSGAFSDKAADTVKEFGLRIRELTPAAEEALKAFSDQRQEFIRNAAAAGQTEEALEAVLEGLSEGEATVQEFQTVIADLFGGPGEDLGQERLLALLESTDFLERELTDLEKANERVLKSTQLVEEAQGDLAAEFKGVGTGLQSFGNQIKAALIDRVTVVVQVFKEAFAPIGEFINQIGELISDILPEGAKQFDFLEASLQVFRASLTVALVPIKILGNLLVLTIEQIRSARDSFLEWIDSIKQTTAFQTIADILKTVITRVQDFISGIRQWAETTPIIRDVLKFFERLSSAIGAVAQGIKDLIFGIEEEVPKLTKINTVLSSQLAARALDVSEGKKNIDAALKDLFGQLGVTSRSAAVQQLFDRFGTENAEAIKAQVRNIFPEDEEFAGALDDFFEKLFADPKVPEKLDDDFKTLGMDVKDRAQKVLEETVEEDPVEIEIPLDIEFKSNFERAVDEAFENRPELSFADEITDEADRLAQELETINVYGALGVNNPSVRRKAVEELQKIVDEGGVNAEAAAQQIQAVTDQIFREIGQGAAATGQALAGVLSGIGDLLQGPITEAEERLELLREQRDAELEAVGENEEARQAIEDRFAEQEAQREQRIQELKERQLRFDKAAGITNAIINTATGVTKALATLPPPFSFITAALTAAQGAIQIAVIRQQQIPAFETGTADAPGGIAIVGEAGPELVVTPEGKVMESPGEATLIDLPKHSKVFTAKETEQILNNIDQDVSLDKEMAVVSTGMDPEQFERLITERDKDILEAIDSQRVQYFNVTERSIDLWTKHKGGRTKYFSDRYGKK